MGVERRAQVKLIASVVAAAFLAAPSICTAGSVDLTAPRFGTWGVDLAGMDQSTAPGDDFFDYVNGGWIKRTVIPPDRTSIGPFFQLRRLGRAREHAILLDAAAGRLASPDARKAGLLYAAYMDLARLNALGATPLTADLQQIRSGDKVALARVMGRAPESFFPSLFELRLDSDDKDRARYAVYIGQSGLGLPDRDFYLKPEFSSKLAAYERYAYDLLRLCGVPNEAATMQAHAIVALETRVAQASWTRAQVRDPERSYRAMPLQGLNALAPAFPWHEFLQASGLGSARRVVLTTDDSVAALSKIYAETPLPVLQAWMTFRTADAAADYLSPAIGDRRFAFRSVKLQGVAAQQPRDERAAVAVDSVIGPAVGEVYTARFFPAAYKAAVEAIVDNLKAAFRTHINVVSWLTPATKAEAQRKLNNLRVQVGYPNEHIDYSELVIREDDLYGDMKRGRAFDWRRRVARADSPVDQEEWRELPQVGVAYTDDGAIVFPASMLQPPFFDPKADAAVNYGGIGYVIGHELTHSFDDQGRHTDADFKLRTWWTTAESARFDQEAQKLALQFSGMEPLPGAHLNGQATLGEDLADLGGLELALSAYRLSLGAAPAPVLDGFSGDQRVFLGFAQVHRAKTRPEAERVEIASDPHSPDRERVNGVVRNVDGWYRAFDVGPGERLYLPPPQRTKIW